MRRSAHSPILFPVLLLLALTACQGDPLDPAFGKTKVSRTLTVTGAGTGGGTVSAPDYGEAGALGCQIVAGGYDPIYCTKVYGWKTSVVLTATPNNGSSFAGWSGACTGTAPTCKTMMTQSRSVRATFTGAGVPSYALNVGGAGTGSGQVTSQSGLSPAINCTITSGTATSGACTGTYPSGTSVVLSLSPAGGSTFDGWSGACTGTGTCTVSVTGNAFATANLTAPPGIEATVGRWEAPLFAPVIGLHLSLLPSGKTLLWGHGGEPQVWNPLGGAFTQVANRTCTDPTTCELFCAGQTFLEDGRLLVAGGHNEALGDNNGLKQASTYDSTGWQATGSMTYARWYPTLVTLEDNSVVALSGNQAPGLHASVPERWNGSSWTPLTGASLSLPLYPRAFVEPKNGHVFIAGDAATTRFLNPNGSGSWTTGPTRIVANRSYGSAVMLDSKVLYAGGGGNGCPGAPEKTAEIIDLAAASPSWSPTTGQMEIGRRQTNLTILADGQVLVTGGSSQCGFTNETGAVFAAELWNPATGLWTRMANAAVVRVYHSTTVLLPDGRVYSTGSGDGGGVTQQNSYEIYSPPYLFKGPRPTYSVASTDMRYGQPFSVGTADAASIRKVLLIRLATSTHAHDMGQRLNTLAYTVSADGLTLAPPASGRIAPPGPYMLFLVNDRGVPSVAQTILLSQ